MPNSELRARLQRLRPQKARPDLPPSVPLAALKARALPSPAEALPGREMATPLGAFQLIENAYPLAFVHGAQPLSSWPASDPLTALRLIRQPAAADLELRSMAFVDIETTGLAGGTGTLAFLVGAGICQGEQFVLRQYFLRDPGEEEAMLSQLVDDLASASGWVTFNGGAFDMPILETRLTLNRQRGRLGQRPHLDLLPVARRLYRRRLPSCALGDLERHVLGLVREQDDVPGALIPEMYVEFLRSGQTDDMRRVIYHNAMDILSMVTLGAHLVELFATPLPAPASAPAAVDLPDAVPAPAEPPRQPPETVLRLAYWHEDRGRLAEAETAYRLALAGELDVEDLRQGLTRWAALLKRQDRRAEAAPVWEQLAAFSTDDPDPFVELAKYYEWHAPDFDQAVAWTERALKVVKAWPADWRRTEETTELKRRLERLKAKRGGNSRKPKEAAEPHD
jgi:uncharacterized protein YprB with RNaseH-like and TPR domain